MNDRPMKCLTHADRRGGDLSASEREIADQQDGNGVLSDEERKLSKQIEMPRRARRVKWE